MRRPVLAAAFLLTVLTPATASAAPTPTPASATGISPHCQEAGYCLFSGTSFTGTRAVPQRFGCFPVSDLGFDTARSAARGSGDGSALVLYSDTSCATSVATVYYEVPNTAAKSYRMLPIPS